MKLSLAAAALALLSLPFLLGADAPPAPSPAAQPRPRITGLSHIALYCHDMSKTLDFYKKFLGFEEPYSLKNTDGSLHLTWIKINDLQTIELFPEKEPNTDRLYHIALITPDAVAMREYLAAHRVKVPAKVGKGKIGNANYFISDPDGHTVEIVTYEPDSWTIANAGKFLPDTRISTHMPHVGILVGDLDESKKFYEGILGFHELWRGSKKPEVLSWVHEQVPEGTDFIELMLYSDLPDPTKRGTAHHLCLEVPDIEKARAILAERAPTIGYTRPLTIQTGVNRKRTLRALRDIQAKHLRTAGDFGAAIRGICDEVAAVHGVQGHMDEFADKYASMAKRRIANGKSSHAYEVNRAINAANHEAMKLRYGVLLRVRWVGGANDWQARGIMETWADGVRHPPLIGGDTDSFLIPD
ncbi:MAG: VOC family protein [Phycisphaerae bacterium]